MRRGRTTHCLGLYCKLILESRQWGDAKSGSLATQPEQRKGNFPKQTTITTVTITKPEVLQAKLRDEKDQPCEDLGEVCSRQRDQLVPMEEWV